MNPEYTLTKTERVEMAKINFPLNFKVCIKPGFDDAELKKMGYKNNIGYLWGQSKYNSSIHGWAGHTSDGKIVSNVSGEEKLSKIQLLMNEVQITGNPLACLDLIKSKSFISIYRVLNRPILRFG